MANEAIVKYGTQKTLEASGASTADAAFSQADDASYATADHGDYPDAEFALKVTFSVAPTAGKAVSLYVQPLNIDGTNDAPAPDANFKGRFVGNFLVDAVTTAQYLSLIGRDLPKEGAYYIENNAGQTISAGWTLKATPRTYGPSA